MKAYKIISAEEEIISGNTLIEALKFYLDLTGNSIDDFNDSDDIVEVPESEWDKIIVANTEYDEKDKEDKEQFTLRELVEQSIEPELLTTTCI